MTKQEKENALSLPSIGYWSACGGVEVKQDNSDINDHIVVVAGAWTGHKTVHSLQVYVAPNGDCYIKLRGYKLMFADCIAM